MLALLCGLLLSQRPTRPSAVAAPPAGRKGVCCWELLGQMRIVQSQIWLEPGKGSLSRLALWSIWLPCAARSWIDSGDACLWHGRRAWLGGSLSHALETTHRGGICDYVCLRFWPAFNVAHAAITLSAAGIALPTISCPLR
ncbi:MAG: hypothetical protein U0992_04060 [Planctomycetaceae bacterium]